VLQSDPSLPDLRFFRTFLVVVAVRLFGIVQRPTTYPHPPLHRELTRLGYTSCHWGFSSVAIDCICVATLCDVPGGGFVAGKETFPLPAPVSFFAGDGLFLFPGSPGPSSLSLHVSCAESSFSCVGGALVLFFPLSHAPATLARFGEEIARSYTVFVSPLFFVVFFFPTRTGAPHLFLADVATCPRPFAASFQLPFTGRASLCWLLRGCAGSRYRFRFFELSRNPFFPVVCDDLMEIFCRRLLVARSSLFCFRVDPPEVYRSY